MKTEIEATDMTKESDIPVNCETDNNDPTEKMADDVWKMSLDQFQARELEIQARVSEIEAMIKDVTTKAEEHLDTPTYTPREYLAALDQLQARESELKAALDEVREAKDIRRIVEETRHGVEILVQHLPVAKKPPHIEYAEAVAIMKLKGGDMTDRTLRNWLKEGLAGRVKLPISWYNLASTESWSAWVDYYLGKEKIRITRKREIH